MRSIRWHQKIIGSKNANLDKKRKAITHGPRSENENFEPER